MGMSASYCYYLATFGVSIFFAGIYGERAGRKITKINKIFYALLIALPVIVLQGFRYSVGTDYMSYANLSRGFAEGDPTYIGWYSNEPLFLLFSRLCYLVSGNPYFYFLADAVIANILLFFIADYYRSEINLPVFYLLYYCICMSYFLNAERQGIAVLIVWFSMRYVDRSKPFRFIFCIVIATLIHNTALIGVTIYLFKILQGSKIKTFFKRIVLTVLFLSPLWMGAAAGFIGRFQIFRKYTRFLNDLGTWTNANLLFALAMGAFLVLLFLSTLKKIKDRDRWVFLYGTQLASYVATAYYEFAFRISYYFQFGIFYAYGAVAKRTVRRENRMLLYLAVIVFALFHFTYKFYIQGNSDIFPYRFVWMQ